METPTESDGAVSTKARGVAARQRARYLALVGLSSALLVARVALTSRAYDAVALARAAVPGLVLAVVGLLAVDALFV